MSRLFLAAALVFMVAPARAIENPWSRMVSPTEGPPESIGTPSAGCLKGARALGTATGGGYLLMRPSRDRRFGHPRLVSLIESVGRDRAARGRPPLLIGDLGLPRGGPTMSAHASHQTGLDADIWYLQYPRWKGSRKISFAARERLQAASMVDSRRLSARKSFGRNERELLRSFASSPEVERILVHFALKRELCRVAPNEPWIRKIRPWFGHDHHFHVRLQCAAGDRLCRNGEPIPEGNGCDATLDWWWSDEARAEAAKNLGRQEHPVMPALPAECAPLAADSGARRS